MIRTAFTAFTATLILAGTAAAQERADGWRMGGFATLGPSIYAGEDNDLSVIPAISYQTGRWQFGLNGVSAQVWDEGGSALEVLLRPRFFGLVFADAPELAGIDRDITGDVGASWSYDVSPVTSIEVTGLVEVTGAHGGQEIELKLDQEVSVAGFPLFVGASVTWQSADLSGYLYGVSASEATGSRAAYEPGSVLIPEVSISSGYPLGSGAFLFGGVRYSVLPGEVSSSPIVTRDDDFGVFVGVTRSF